MEGFQGVEEDLAKIVRDAAENLRAAGAEVGEMSLPIHNDGGFSCILIVIYVQF